MLAWRSSGTWLARGVPIALLTAGALGLGLFAWREAGRAARTEAVLMHDYAAFVADKFVRVTAAEYARASGLSGALRGAGTDAPFSVLHRHARALAAGGTPALPAPGDGIARYLFEYDAREQRLSFSGEAPGPVETRRLRTALAGFAPGCGADELVPLGRLSAAPAPGARDLAWSVLLQTDERAAVRRVLGFRAAEEPLARALFAPLTSRLIQCECPSNLVPASLAAAGSTDEAASFVLRDGDGVTVFQSEPQYPGAPSVRQAMSPEVPFPGWTVEVAVNPAVVRPLLPNGGRGVPLSAFALLAAVVAGSGVLAFVSLHRDRELWRARQDFVSNVTHELKTPLARIRLFNDLLRADRQEDAGKRRRYRRVIDRDCRRLTMLVERVLEFARGERAPRLRRELVDLRRVVAGAIELVADEAGRVSGRLERVPPIRGDVETLEQVVLNLLDNALKYSPADRPVEVSLTADGGWATLCVRDHGCGIPQRERRRIFDDFYRVESGDTQRASGSGLGLALVRRGVAAHRGRVEVESAPDRGSAFTVALPLAPPAAGDAGSRGERP